MARERFDDEYDDARDDDRPRRRRAAGDPARGREMVRGPGLALLLYGLFCLVWTLLTSALLVGSPDTIAKPYHDWLTNLTKDLPKNPNQPPPVPPYEEFRDSMRAQGVIGAGIGLVVSVVLVLGGVKLRAARSKGLAMTGSVLAMIPLSGCCLIGLPIGIWAVVTMGKPDVKAAFAAAARPATFDDLDDPR